MSESDLWQQLKAELSLDQIRIVSPSDFTNRLDKLDDTDRKILRAGVTLEIWFAIWILRYERADSNFASVKQEQLVSLARTASDSQLNPSPNFRARFQCAFSDHKHAKKRYGTSLPSSSARSF